MNEVGPPRPPLSRAAPILAVGLALVLAGGFAVGIFVGRKPPPDASPAADQVLPPVTTLPANVPVQPVPSPPPPPPPPVVTPPAPPPPTPIVAKPPPPAKPEAPIPAHKPSPESHKPASTAPAGKEPKPPAASRMHKPETAHGLPRPAQGGRWVVQLGAFESDDHAKLLVDTLAYHGHAARIAGGHGRDGHEWYFVQTPGYATRAEAESVARVLRRAEHLPTYVFEAHRPPGD